MKSGIKMSLTSEASGSERSETNLNGVEAVSGSSPRAPAVNETNIREQNKQPEINLKRIEAMSGASKQILSPAVNDENISQQKKPEDSCIRNPENGNSLMVFRGKTFCFSNSFPEDRVSFSGQYNWIYIKSLLWS